ncbi:Crp/Fnr family transcriptional regulator [Maribellus maritimus]|uniref:Crp/Fnr family transcriptional regulator n=1 Tax=Maribellus maritimus TaxID=2870838 RepID=UPI001EE9B6A5|nr:Crp/Fnr family transcriptional regulator [Maribellus maritimus]MCG6189521.1 Crp/Fnr family transcriptional regulator [Maribellus maritimus]
MIGIWEILDFDIITSSIIFEVNEWEMSDLLKKVNDISPLSVEALEELVKCIQTKVYDKGILIHTEGRVNKQLFFVESGLVKHFYYHDGNQFVLRFFEENNFFIATDSFFNDLPAEYSTLALEETVISHLEYDDFERLCQKYHSFESFARKFVSIVAYTAISNLKGLLYLDATERYAKFIKEYGHLQQRISLGDTAGYLGISQVQLSRIRSKK